MSSARNHMKRSRRSNKFTNSGLFINFNRNAYTQQLMKENKKTTLQRLSSLLKKTIPST